MANIKKFRVEYTPGFGEIVVQVDLDFVQKVEQKDGSITEYPVLDLMKQMILFFDDGEDNLALNDGDVLNTFLRHLCRKVMKIVTYLNLNAEGVIVHMDQEEEGWCILDGSYGIKLLSVEAPDLSSEDDFEIIEVNN